MKSNKIISEILNGKKFIYRRAFETKYFGYYIYNQNTKLIEYYEIDHKTLKYKLHSTMSVDDFYSLIKVLEYRDDVHWKNNTLIVDLDFNTDYIKNFGSLTDSDIKSIKFCHDLKLDDWFGLSYDEYIDFYIDNKEYKKYLKTNK